LRGGTEDLDVDGRNMVTHIRPLREFAAFTELECRLETGRTNQIRIQLSELSHPLCGDVKYRGPHHASEIPDHSEAPRLAPARGGTWYRTPPVQHLTPLVQPLAPRHPPLARQPETFFNRVPITAESTSKQPSPLPACKHTRADSPHNVIGALSPSNHSPILQNSLVFAPMLCALCVYQKTLLVRRYFAIPDKPPFLWWYSHSLTVASRQRSDIRDVSAESSCVYDL
jgi:hypothetical protein